MNPPRDGLTVLPVRDIGEVTPDTDLVAAIGTAAPWLRDHDVLVVTSKIVSKAEGRLVPVPVDGPGRVKAHADAVAAETDRVVAARGATRIVATRHGFVLASAGVDASNVDPTHLVLLPRDPDASARALRAGLADRYGVRVAVVVSDTMGRPWRNGLTDVALGAAGLSPLRDHRGQTDPYGNALTLTTHAVADELAAAAELVKGKTDGVPVAVVRNAAGPASVVTEEDGPGVVATLVREPEWDMFPLGTAEARAEGLRTAATLATPGAEAADTGGDGAADGGAEPAAVRRAIATAAPWFGADTRCTLTDPTGGGIHCTLAGAAAEAAAGHTSDPAAWFGLGRDVQRLCAALAAEQIAADVADPAPGEAPDGVLLRLRPAAF